MDIIINCLLHMYGESLKDVAESLHLDINSLLILHLKHQNYHNRCG